MVISETGPELGHARELRESNALCALSSTESGLRRALCAFEYRRGPGLGSGGGGLGSGVGADLLYLLHATYPEDSLLLTITTTHRPATDLGYLLHKNPARVQSFELSFGRAHVFYEQADDERCTAALLLEVDPISLVRRRGPGTLDQYVNDRPYAASSFMSTAISRVFGSALAGRCTDKPNLVNKAIPLHATIQRIAEQGWRTPSEATVRTTRVWGADEGP